MNIPIYQIDAFTDRLFKGNPAAICPLEEWISDDIMQNIAKENNLAETAFVVIKNNKYEIRWFTPEVEVDLCGHATLAAAHMLFNYDEDIETDEIEFYSHRSGILKVKKSGDLYELNFPSDNLKKIKASQQVLKAIKEVPVEVFMGKTDYMLVYDSQKKIEDLNPDFSNLINIKARGIIVTAKGNKTDFVSRFFAPQSGINEDPVTGSAHTSLIPYWSEKLKKTEMTAKQLSKREGKLFCKFEGKRVKISGQAITYMIGMIEIADI